MADNKTEESSTTAEGTAADQSIEETVEAIRISDACTQTEDTESENDVSPACVRDEPMTEKERRKADFAAVQDPVHAHENMDYYLAQYKFLLCDLGIGYNVVFFICLTFLMASIASFNFIHSAETPRQKNNYYLMTVCLLTATAFMIIKLLEDFRIIEDVIRACRRRQTHLLKKSPSPTSEGDSDSLKKRS